MNKKIILWSCLIFILLSSTVMAGLSDNQVLYYKSDINGTFTDSHGSYDGTINGAKYITSGKILGAYDYNGGSYYINTNYRPYIENKSYSFWARTNDTSVFNFLGAHDETGTAFTIKGNYPSATDRLAVYFMQGGSNQWIKYASGTDLSNNQWHHFVITIGDVSANQVKIYVDSNNMGLSTHAVSGTVPNFQTTQDLDIGQRGDGIEFYDGAIDEIGIWDIVLTQQEVNTLYNSGAGYQYPYDSNFSITTNSLYSWANINGTVYTTTDGVIETYLPTVGAPLYNIITSPNNFKLNQTYNNYNISTPLIVEFPLLNITAYNIYNSSNIINFTLNISSEEFSSYINSTTTLDGNIEYYLVNGNYTAIITTAGFATRNTTFDLSTSQNYTFLLPYTNSINITIYDQTNGSLITRNTTVRFTDINGQFERTPTNGTLFEYNLTAGTWTIDFIAENYTVTTYSANVTDRSFQNLAAYLLPTSDQQTIFTTKDKDSGELIEGVSVAVLRIINSEWTLINTLSSDVSGRVGFTYETGVKYRFIVSKGEYTTKTFDLNPILFNSYNILLEKTIVFNDNSDYSNVNIAISPSGYYNDANNTIVITFISPAGGFQTYAYNATYKTTTVSGSGSNLYGGSLTNNLSITGATALDKVILEYSYRDTTGKLHQYKQSYFISDSGGLFGTAKSNEDNPYNIPLFDRVMIMVIATTIIAGLAFLYGGTPVAGLIAIGVMGYFGYIKFVNPWLVIISIIVLLALVAWRSSN